MKGRELVMAAVLATAASAVAAEWKNVDEDHYLAGRKCSAGYLKGKVVLVDRWGFRCPPCRALLPRAEEIWKSFKTKPFVLLGGHCEGWGTPDEVKSLVADAGVSYPVYQGAALAEGEPSFNAIPFLYVVDETGKVLYSGHDERRATEIVVTALTDLESPRDLAQWKRFLDYEIKELPGRACLRYLAFKKAFPKEAKAYEVPISVLKKIPDMRKLAELVDYARKAKDMRAFDPKKGKAQKEKFVKGLKAALVKYAPLKESADPRVQQEAKNALADIAWTLAAQ